MRYCDLGCTERSAISLSSAHLKLDAILRFFGCINYVNYIDSIHVLRKVSPHKHPTNK